MYDQLITNLGWLLFSVVALITIPLLIFYEIFMLNRKVNEKLDRVVGILQRIESLNRVNSHRSKSMVEKRVQYLEETLFSISEQSTGFSSISDELEIGARNQVV